MQLISIQNVEKWFHFQWVFFLLFHLQERKIIKKWQMWIFHFEICELLLRHIPCMLYKWCMFTVMSNFDKEMNVLRTQKCINTSAIIRLCVCLNAFTPERRGKAQQFPSNFHIRITSFRLPLIVVHFVRYYESKCTDFFFSIFYFLIERRTCVEFTMIHVNDIFHTRELKEIFHSRAQN